MPETCTSARTFVQPSADARNYGSAIAFAPLSDGANRLTEYFANPKGYAWRTGFQEPTLDQVKGMGAKLLSFDF
jgi:hypothetical protein